MRSFPTGVLLLALAPGFAGATCPLTRYSLYGGETLSAEPVGSAHAYSPYYPYDGDGSVSWNAPLGALSVGGCSAGHHGSAGGQIWTTDDFEILGSPPGVPVRVTAAVDVTGSYYSFFSYWSTSSGGLTDEAGRAVSGQIGEGNAPIRLALPLDMVAGDPQRLTYWAYGSAGGSCTGTGVRLVFPDLPPGMSIVSCRGFQSGAITPTRAISWGRLKLIYR